MSYAVLALTELIHVTKRTHNARKYLINISFWMRMNVSLPSQFLLLLLAVCLPLDADAVYPDPEEELLKTLFYEEQFAYVLFGAKPMATTTFWERSRWENVHSCRPYPLDAKAFDIWKKNCHKYAS
ncbi:MAG TPA: hypothetical protein VN457_00780, partial [Chlamydiales bacterium]|nr:hypothetical protein [Chlamydiales bacterium]